MCSYDVTVKHTNNKPLNPQDAAGEAVCKRLSFAKHHL